MLSLSYLYESDNDNTLIFSETLIDLMFDYIEDSNILENDILEKDLILFKNKVNNIFNIQLIYKQYNNTYISGVFVKPNIIILYIPNNKKYLEHVTGKTILRVFLHELSHYFTNEKIPDFLIIKNKTNLNQTILSKIENKLKHPPSSNIAWNESNLNLVQQFLDYIFQSKELPNFALTFSLSFINNKNENIDTFLKDNKTILSKDLNTTLHWYNSISDNDLRLLFQIQYFTKYLKQSKYQRKLIDLQKLIKKYYRRLSLYYKE